MKNRGRRGSSEMTGERTVSPSIPPVRASRFLRTRSNAIWRGGRIVHQLREGHQNGDPDHQIPTMQIGSDAPVPGPPPPPMSATARLPSSIPIPSLLTRCLLSPCG